MPYKDRIAEPDRVNCAVGVAFPVLDDVQNAGGPLAFQWPGLFVPGAAWGAWHGATSGDVVDSREPLARVLTPPAMTQAGRGATVSVSAGWH
jgi:hypothetical protein